MDDIDHLIERFLERLSKIEGKSYHTIRAYRSTLLYFKEFLINRGYTLDDVDEEVIEEFLIYLANRGLKPRSLKRHLDALRKFLKYIKKHDIDWDSLRIPVKESYNFKILSEEDVKRIIDYAYQKNYVYGLMMQLGYEAGLRASELADLNFEDVNVNECFIYVRPKKREETKIAIPISIDLCNKIKRYLEYRPIFPGDPLFTTKFGNRWRPYLISNKIFREIAEELGYYDVRYHDYARHCLDSKTRILTIDGIISAEELWHRRTNLITINLLTGKEVISKYEPVFKTTSSSIEIWAGGRHIICSPEHRLFTIEKGNIKEIMAKDVKAGMYLAGIRYLPKPYEKNYYDSKIWRIIGYYVGKGHFIKNKHIINLHDENREIIDYYAKICEELGLKHNIRSSNDRDGYILEIHSEFLVSIIDNLGLMKTIGERRVPNILYTATDEEISEFIAGYYDAVGLKNTDREIYPTIYSNNLDLIKDIQLLLLELGIDSKIMESYKETTLSRDKLWEDYEYTLTIYNTEKFVDKISTCKELKVIKHVKERKHDVIPLKDILGFDLEYDDVKRLIEQGERGFRSISTYRNVLERVNKAKLMGINIEFYIKSNIKWLKVTKINKPGRRKAYLTRRNLYDFETETQTIIADGFIVHNSRATNLLKKGLDIYVVSRLLRHRSLNTTTKYIHLLPEDLRKKLYDIDKKKLQ